MKIINFFIYLTVFLFSFGQLGRISIPQEPVFGYLYEVSLVISLVALFVRYTVRPFELKKGYVRYSLFFICWLIITFLVSVPFYPTNQNIVASLYLLRLVMYFQFLLYVIYHVRHHADLDKKLLLFVFSLGILLPSAVQYFLYQDFGNLAYLGWDPHQYRLVGLFFDPPITVTILALVLNFIYHLYVQSKSRYLIALGTIVAIMIALTYSRGGYIALGITVAYIFIKKMKLYHVLGILIVGIAMVTLISRTHNESLNLFRTTSIFTRFADYETGLDIFKKNSMLGIGYNHIRYEKDAYISRPDDEIYNPSHSAASFHSSFLMILVTSGIVGVVLIVLVLKEMSAVSEYAKYSVIFIAVISFFDNVLLHPFILYFLFLTIAVSCITRPSDTLP